jgi:hypothetical protein
VVVPDVPLRVVAGAQPVQGNNELKRKPTRPQGQDQFDQATRVSLAQLHVHAIPQVLLLLLQRQLLQRRSHAV